MDGAMTTPHEAAARAWLERLAPSGVAGVLRVWGDDDVALLAKLIAAEVEKATAPLIAEHKFLNDLKNERTAERDAALQQVAALREALKECSHAGHDSRVGGAVCDKCGADWPHHRPRCSLTVLINDTVAAAEARDREIADRARREEREHWAALLKLEEATICEYVPDRYKATQLIAFLLSLPLAATPPREEHRT